jgi:hypothetical protein
VSELEPVTSPSSIGAGEKTTEVLVTSPKGGEKLGLLLAIDSEWLIHACAPGAIRSYRLGCFSGLLPPLVHFKGSPTMLSEVLITLTFRRCRRGVGLHNRINETRGLIAWLLLLCRIESALLTCAGATS